MNYNLLTSFGGVLSYIGYILLSILILLIMITVHEFGHYVAGKIFKFGIEEFSIGFGPKLFSKKKKDGEIFSVRALPIGGFCAFRGEDKDDIEPDAFNNQKWWKRIIVLVSGALMNYILAVLVIMLMFGIYGQTVLVPMKIEPTQDIKAEYCLQEKDIIINANGKNVYILTDLMNAIEGKNKGDLVDFVVRRGGKDTSVRICLRTDAHFSNLEDVERLFVSLGISYEKDDNGTIVSSELYQTSISLGFFQLIGRSFEYSFMQAGTIFKILGQLITGAMGVSSLGGTVTTVALTADAIRIGGFRYMLNMTGFIGVNLAVFNLLPIPALDGSRVVFTVIEGIRRKPINRRVEGIIHNVGLFALLLFAVFIDLQRCF